MRVILPLHLEADYLSSILSLLKSDLMYWPSFVYVSNMYCLVFLLKSLNIAPMRLFIYRFLLSVFKRILDHLPKCFRPTSSKSLVPGMQVIGVTKITKVIDFCAKKYELHITSEIIIISHSALGDVVISWIGRFVFIFEMGGNKLHGLGPALGKTGELTRLEFWRSCSNERRSKENLKVSSTD